MAAGVAFSAVPPAAVAGAADAPTVEAARQVTVDREPTRLFDVPTVVVDPRDPLTVVVAVGDARSGGCQLRVSHDGGLSWETTAKTLMPDKLPYCVHRNTGSYIAPAFASDGTLYVGMSGTSLETGHPNGPMTAVVARTKDLGKTHETFTVATARTDLTFTNDDGRVETNIIEQQRYASLAVDPTDPNLVYRGWRYGLRGTDIENAAPRQPLVAVSHDGAATWSKPVSMAASLAGGDKIYAGDVPVLVVAPNHTVYAFTKEQLNVNIPAANRPSTRLFMGKSTDQGKTWTTSVVYGGVSSVTNPFAAVDPRDGSLYVTWDEREGTGPQRIKLTASHDGGATWSTPTVITDDDPAKGIEHYNPGVSVAPNGRVDVAWFDFRNDPSLVPRTATAAPRKRYADIYTASSTDGGKTWSANLRVNDRAIDTSVGVTFGNFDLRGPLGIASTDAAAYVTWPDSRAGSASLESEDAYLTRIRFAPLAGAEDDNQSPVGWAIGGAGAGLALAGIALAIAVTAGRRSRSAGTKAAAP